MKKNITDHFKLKATKLPLENCPVYKGPVRFEMFEFTYEFDGKKIIGFAGYYMNQQSRNFIINLNDGYLIIGPIPKMKQNIQIVWIQFPTYGFKKQSDEIIQALGHGIMAGGFLIY